MAAAASVPLRRLAGGAHGHLAAPIAMPAYTMPQSTRVEGHGRPGTNEQSGRAPQIRSALH
eukprot:6199251-Pleurochrysis_carterae.AAC.1